MMRLRVTLNMRGFEVIDDSFGTDGLRDCFATPIPEIFEAANLLDYAVSAHLGGDATRADMLLRAADMPILGEWLDPIWTAPHRQVVRSEERRVGKEC